MKLLHHSALFAAAALLGLAMKTNAAAAVLTVGADSSCTHHSLDDAIKTARARAGHDEIRLARNLVQESELALDLGSDITLIGGYSNCADSSALGITRVHLLGNTDTDWLAQHAHGTGLRFEAKGAHAAAPSARGILMAK